MRSSTQIAALAYAVLSTACATATPPPPNRQLADTRAAVRVAEGNEVVLYGVSDLVVVTHNGLTLVTTTRHATDLKQLLNELPARVRDRE